MTSPRTPKGKLLLGKLEGRFNDMTTILDKNMSQLVDKTCNVPGFGVKLVEADLLNRVERNRIMQVGIETDKLTKIYDRVLQSWSDEHCVGLIYAWEGDNKHIIDLLLKQLEQTAKQQSNPEPNKDGHNDASCNEVVRQEAALALNVNTAGLAASTITNHGVMVVNTKSGEGTPTSQFFPAKTTDSIGQE